MRSLRTSRTFTLQLAELLDFGATRYSDRRIADKQRLVIRCLQTIIREYPEAKQRHPQLDLVAYPVSRTPFIVLYDFDDHEVRIHFIVHQSADLDAVDPGSADWS